MIYTVMIFYGVLELPLGIFIISMQFSIGAMIFLRKFAFRHVSKGVHYAASLSIILAYILAIISISVDDNKVNDGEFSFSASLVFLLSCIPYLISQVIK